MLSRPLIYYLCVCQYGYVLSCLDCSMLVIRPQFEIKGICRADLDLACILAKSFHVVVFYLKLLFYIPVLSSSMAVTAFAALYIVCI